MKQPDNTVIRKLALPLKFKLSEDALVFDGFFTLSRKDASEVQILGVDQDGYVKCAIVPPRVVAPSVSLLEVLEQATFLGNELTKSKGKGVALTHYRYYRLNNGNYRVMINGSRKRNFTLGQIKDRDSPISKIAQIIVERFPKNTFTKKTLTSVLPRNLQYGQVLKSSLDIMTIEKYLERRIPQQKTRIKELFKLTDKLLQEFQVTPRTSLESVTTSVQQN